MEEGYRAGLNEQGGMSFPRKGRRLKKGELAAWWFPVLFVYLEFVLHLTMGMDLQYVPIYTCFALSAGLLLGSLAELLPGRWAQMGAILFTGLLGVLYTGELLCKKILQSYYQLLSTANTAIENNLMDYKDAILDGIWENLPIILLLLAPTVVAVIWGRRLLPSGIRNPHRTAALLVGAAVAHLLGVAALYLPWQGDLKPRELYRMDTNVEDQVEQLGLWTMLRLDIRHAFVPAENELDSDFSVEEEPDEPEHPPQEVDTSPNQMDVDLKGLAAQSDNEDVNWLASYFDSVTPTRKNEYTGMFKGYNVIMLSLEGFSGYAIDPELTPTLYRLTHEGFVCSNFYTPLHYTSTSGGECQNLLGLYPKSGNPITLKETGVRKTNCYFTLAQQLGRLGYTNLGYHGNCDMYGRYASHTNLGYEWKQYQTGLPLEMKSDGSTYAWPQSDVYVAQTSMEDYLDLETPFHVYYMTISGHMPYNFNRVAKKYKDLVEPLEYSETTKAYLATAIEVDRMFQALLDGLERAGKLDKTLIVATADHIPYFNVDTLEELSGQRFGSSEDIQSLNERSINFDVYRNSLILWSASMKEPVMVDKPCSQVDILPTVSNLLGLEYDSRMLPGTDILSDAPPLVVFSSQSWKTDKGTYNRYTKTFTPSEGISMTAEEQESYVDSIKKKVRYKLGCTEKILNTDFFTLCFQNKNRIVS